MPEKTISPPRSGTMPMNLATAQLQASYRAEVACLLRPLNLISSNVLVLDQYKNLSNFFASVDRSDIIEQLARHTL
jgi:hypothetical protein